MAAREYRPALRTAVLHGSQADGCSIIPVVCGWCAESLSPTARIKMLLRPSMRWLPLRLLNVVSRRLHVGITPETASPALPLLSYINSCKQHCSWGIWHAHGPWCRLQSPRLQSPRLQSPRLQSPRLQSPRLRPLLTRARLLPSSQHTSMAGNTVHDYRGLLQLQNE